MTVEHAPELWQVACHGQVMYEGPSEVEARKLRDHLDRNSHRPALYRAVIDWQLVEP